MTEKCPVPGHSLFKGPSASSGVELQYQHLQWAAFIITFILIPYKPYFIGIFETLKFTYCIQCIIDIHSNSSKYMLVMEIYKGYED